MTSPPESTDDPATDGGRTKNLSIYVTEDEYREIKHEAEQNGESLSGYALRLVRQARRADQLEATADEFDVEARLEELVRDATADVEAAAAALRDMQARMGVYTIANFILQNREYPDPLRREALQNGHERLRLPWEEHDAAIDLANAPATDTDDDDDDDDDGGSDLEDRIR